MTKSLSLKQLTFTLTSLIDLGREITSSKSLHDKMRTALYVITGMFSVPKAALFVYEPTRSSLTVLAGKGVAKTDEIRLALQARDVQAFKINEPCSPQNGKNGSFFERNSMVFTSMQTVLFIPLFAGEELVGAIALGSKLGGVSYRRRDKDVLKVIAHQLAITVHHARLFFELAERASEIERLYRDMKHMYHDTVQGFAAAIDVKDAYTKNHSCRVANYAVAVAQKLGWSKEEIEGLYIAGLLHDIGKIMVDERVLNKEERLTPYEREAIRRHPQISHSILSKINLPWKNVALFVKHHHERIDGTGYPDSLIGSELSDGTKILALADAFDAMITDRPYRKKLSLAEAYREIERCAGTQFDRTISHVFVRVLQKDMKGETGSGRIRSCFETFASMGEVERNVRYDT